jgi:hypothetical protein
MLRTVARGVVLALVIGLGVAIPSAPHAKAISDWPSEPQYAQMRSDLTAVQEANRSVIESGGDIDPATVEYLVSLVPAAVYNDYPLLADLIRGADPFALGVVTHSGANIPGCPAAGRQLMAGFPAPYGLYPINPANNWCMPNGPDNGCNVIPDTIPLTYDFRAACRQHDQGYRWVPAAKFAVDFQGLKDAIADCAKRNLVTRRFCFDWAGIFYAGVTIGGFCCYGNASRPGYNEALAPGAVPTLEPAPTCAQPSHARLATDGGVTTLVRGMTFNMTGVVRKHNRVLFEFFDSSWNLAATHLTYFSDSNCVVRHEPETFNTNRLPLGTVFVTATYAPWENNETVRRQHIATLAITASSGGTWCNQYSHAWVAGGPTVAQGSTVYLTGVVHKQSRITFTFYDVDGNWITQHVTQPARDNCVVHHEPEWFNTGRLPIGTVRVDATFLEWESDQWITRQVGTLTVTEPPPPPPGGDDPPPDGCGIYRIECEPIIY